MNEAIWIGKVLSALPVELASPCLNLRSSENFRKIDQPWIQQYILAPGEARGMRFVHTDVKKAPGVDLAGDIYEAEFQAHLLAFAPRSVLCCNMFEHVLNRQRLADICTELVCPGGYLIISVPKSFPYRLDPIDTYFRPTPVDIASLFPQCEIVASDVVMDKTYWQELSLQPIRQRLMTLFQIGVHFFLPFYKWQEEMNADLE